MKEELYKVGEWIVVLVLTCIGAEVLINTLLVFVGMVLRDSSIVSLRLYWIIGLQTIVGRFPVWKKNRPTFGIIFTDAMMNTSFFIKYNS